jgi:8-oxo-dGTP diphosphatase
MFDPRVHVGTAALIINPLNRLLMIRRSLNATHGAGQWAVPGGWLDYGETPEEGVLRELKEEVDIDAKQARFVGLVINTHPAPVDHVVCLFYKVPFDPFCRPVIQEPDKTIEHDWVPINRIRDMDLFAPMRSFINESSYDLRLANL